MDKVEVNVASRIWQELLHVFCLHGFLAAWKLDSPRTTFLSDWHLLHTIPFML